MTENITKPNNEVSGINAKQKQFLRQKENRPIIICFNCKFYIYLFLTAHWDEPEKCVARYTEIFYMDRSKTEQASEAGVSLPFGQKPEMDVFPSGWSACGPKSCNLADCRAIVG